MAASEPLMELIRAANAQGKLCAAICAAPTVLAKAGILNGKKAACYPGCEAGLTGAKAVEEDVVSDGNVITSRAVGTAIPFALKLIETLADREAARKIAAAILY